MQSAMAEGRVTSRQLVEQYLQRIGMYEHTLNATIAVNPKALAEADRLDAERTAGRLRGPLHGIPVALKDNIHTTDMPTSDGAVAFEGFIPPYEATLTRHLREAGAIIIAKTVMTELANFIAQGMPGSYSGLGGYGMNPYDPRRDPREATGDAHGGPHQPLRHYSDHRRSRHRRSDGEVRGRCGDDAGRHGWLRPSRS